MPFLVASRIFSKTCDKLLFVAANLSASIGKAAFVLHHVEDAGVVEREVGDIINYGSMSVNRDFSPIIAHQAAGTSLSADCSETLQPSHQPACRDT